MTNVTFIIRLSALGDVAMTLPYLYASCLAHPSTTFYLITTSFPAKLLYHKPDNLQAVVFTKKKDSLISYVFKLHRLNSRADVIDLHDVPRTKWLRFFLRLLGHRVISLSKPRKARKALLSRTPVSVVPKEMHVPSMLSLYAHTLQKAGIFPNNGVGVSIQHHKQGKTIGLALFAQHEGKMLLPTQEEELVLLLSETFPDYTILLYGAHVTYELQRRRELAESYNNVKVSSHLSFIDEMAEIATLSCMISMDSANQHIARFLSVPVVSIWMQTHPASGFLPFEMSESDCIGIDLPCRPCSIYGNKPCQRRDWACKHGLDLKAVVSKVKTHLQS